MMDKTAEERERDLVEQIFAELAALREGQKELHRGMDELHQGVKEIRRGVGEMRDMLHRSTVKRYRIDPARQFLEMRMIDGRWRAVDEGSGEKPRLELSHPESKRR